VAHRAMPLSASFAVIQEEVQYSALLLTHFRAATASRDRSCNWLAHPRWAGVVAGPSDPSVSILFTWNHRPRCSPGLAEWLLRFLSISCECSTLDLPTAPCIGGPLFFHLECVLANSLSATQSQRKYRSWT